MVGARHEYPTWCEIRVAGLQSPSSDRTTSTPNAIAYTGSSSNTGGPGAQTVTAVASIEERAHQLLIVRTFA